LFDAPKELEHFWADCFFQIFLPGGTNSVLAGYLPTQAKSNIKNISTDFRNSFCPFSLLTILFKDINNVIISPEAKRLPGHTHSPFLTDISL
jgi:hypothetical protein